MGRHARGAGTRTSTLFHDFNYFQGVKEIDQIIAVLLKTNMFVGGMMGLFLDNTVPGSREERGMVTWQQQFAEGAEDTGSASIHVYDLPLGLNRLSKHKFSKYTPFLPYYPRLEEDLELEGQRGKLQNAGSTQL